MIFSDIIFTEKDGAIAFSVNGNSDFYRIKGLYNILPPTKAISQWSRLRSIKSTLGDGDIVVLGGVAGTLLSKRALIAYLSWALKGGEHKDVINAVSKAISFNKVVEIASTRKEEIFEGKVINKLFAGYKIIPQYPVLDGKYRIDWYIPELDLAIEYDEEHHKFNKEEDEARQKEIEKELGCKFLRYKE